MIEFKNVNLKYIKTFYTIYNANFSINKNTLFVGDAIDGSYAYMRILAKIEKSYTGDIFVEGQNLKKIKQKNLPIAYISHECYFFENKSIFENLFYPLKIRKTNKIEAKRIIFDVFSKFYLEFSSTKTKNQATKQNPTCEEVLAIKVRFLNNQQKKLLSLMRAILRKPKYLLVEDFFSNLETNKQQTAFEILELAQNHSTIIACEDSDNNLACYQNFERKILN